MGAALVTAAVAWSLLLIVWGFLLEARTWGHPLVGRWLKIETLTGPDGTPLYRRITRYDAATRTVTVDSPFTVPLGTPVYLLHPEDPASDA